MDWALYSTLFGLGLAGGLFSGLLGIGGGILMVPLLLYLPPLLGIAPLTMKVVAGITAVQSFVGALAGAAGHHRFRRIHVGLALYLGVPMAVASLAGSVASKFLSDGVILATFAAMAMAAAMLMQLPGREETTDTPLEEVEFSRRRAVLVGTVIGVLAGVVGQGGAFLYIPAMLLLLQIPTRVAIGTALAVGIAASGAVFLGRMGTDQIPWAWSAVLVAGVVLGAQLGSRLSQYTPRAALRQILAMIITSTAIKICLEIA